MLPLVMSLNDTHVVPAIKTALTKDKFLTALRSLGFKYQSTVC